MLSFVGIIWRKDDPHVLYSCSRDFYLFQHVFKDAKRPADELVPAGLDMSIHGDISYATLEKPDLTGRNFSRVIFLWKECMYCWSMMYRIYFFNRNE